jgi:hypothetical protein
VVTLLAAGLLRKIRIEACGERSRNVSTSPAGLGSFESDARTLDQHARCDSFLLTKAFWTTPSVVAE